MVGAQKVFLLMIAVFVQFAAAQLADNIHINIHQENYVTARESFRTHLLHATPSPQEFSPLKMPKGVTEVQFQSGSLTLKAWLNQPVNQKKRYPAVVFLHGGFAFGEDDWQMSRPYRDAGFVVMSPRLRGENGLPGNFSFFYDEVNDVLAAGEYLRSLPYVDPNQIFVAGHSAGGTLAQLAALASDKFRAAASFSGSPDQLGFLEHFPDMKELMPFDEKDLHEIEMRSPLAFAASFKCPARLYYGTEEEWFRSVSQRTAQIAQQNHKDVEAIAVRGDHFGAVPASIQASIAFFRSTAK